jgi:hypothetical protein
MGCEGKPILRLRSAGAVGAGRKAFFFEKKVTAQVGGKLDPIGGFCLIWPSLRGPLAEAIQGQHGECLVCDSWIASAKGPRIDKNPFWTIAPGYLGSYKKRSKKLFFCCRGLSTSALQEAKVFWFPHGGRRLFQKDHYQGTTFPA